MLRDSSRRRGIIVSSAIALLLTVLFFPPPAGLETRSLASLATWYLVSGAVFLILQIVLNVAALILSWRRSQRLRSVSAIWVLISIVFFAIDMSGAGGPVPSSTIQTVEILYALAALVVLGLSLTKPASVSSPRTA
jgi:uncharacterized membrane-anchored protein YitT (DUF2179 family)